MPLILQKRYQKQNDSKTRHSGKSWVSVLLKLSIGNFPDKEKKKKTTKYFCYSEFS